MRVRAVEVTALARIGLREDVLECDKYKLDDEFEEHPKNLWQVVEALAEARSLRDIRKWELEKTEARVRARLLANAEAEGRKATVATLAGEVVQDRSVDVATQELIVAESAFERLQGLLGAMQAKTSALKHLSELAQAQYYVTNAGRRMRPSD